MRAVLLDMDGTLVDSDAAVERCWRAWAIENGINPMTVLDLARGTPATETIRLACPDWDDQRIAAEAHRQLARECADVTGVVPAQGAHRLLAWLSRRALPWGIVTSANRPLAGWAVPESTRRC